MSTEVPRDVAEVVEISNLLLTLASGGSQDAPLPVDPAPFSRGGGDSSPPWEGTDGQGSALPHLWAHLPGRCPSVFASSLESLFEIDSVLPRN